MRWTFLPEGSGERRRCRFFSPFAAFPSLFCASPVHSLLFGGFVLPVPVLRVRVLSRPRSLCRSLTLRQPDAPFALRLDRSALPTSFKKLWTYQNYFCSSHVESNKQQ